MDVRMHVLCIIYVLCMYALCIVYVCIMYYVCMQYVCMYALWLLRAQNWNVGANQPPKYPAL
jgi:hypothetical protein